MFAFTQFISAARKLEIRLPEVMQALKCGRGCLLSGSSHPYKNAHKTLTAIYLEPGGFIASVFERGPLHSDRSAVTEVSNCLVGGKKQLYSVIGMGKLVIFKVDSYLLHGVP